MASQTIGINPYIIGPPISESNRFFGRTTLFDFVRSNLVSGAKVILLHGQRRMGKSSVLAQIPSRVGLPDFVFASLDLQYVSNEPLSAILHKLSMTIAAAVESAGSSVAPVTLEELQQDQHVFRTVFLPRVFSALVDRKLVLLLDEFDVIDDQRSPAASEPFFSYLRTSVNESANLYLVAVVGRRADDLGDMKSLFHEAPSQQIGLLDRDSAIELIQKPAESLLEFRPGAVDAILELTSGHPYFTQLMAYACFQRAEQRKDFVVDRSDVEAVVDRAMETGYAGLVWFHGGLPVRERVLFAAMADCQERTGGPCDPGQVVDSLEAVGVTVTSDLNMALGRIVEWGFVMQMGTASRPLLRVTVELVRRWMVKYHSLRKEIKALEEVSPEAAAKFEAARASHAAGDPSADTLYSETLALNPNHFAALSDWADRALQSRRFADAAGALQRLYRADPTPMRAERLANAFLEAARSGLAEGNLDSARQNVNNALQFESDSQIAASLLDEIEAQNRRLMAGRNPFSVGSPLPPEEFTGHRNQVGLALSALNRRGHVLFFGEPGMGKTSLLRYIASPASWSAFGFDPDKVLPVYVDCSSVRSFSAMTLWQEIASASQVKLTEFGDSPLVSGWWSGLMGKFFGRFIPYTEVSAKARALGDKGRRLIILLDEWDKALSLGSAHMTALSTEIRRLASASHGGASLVVATRRKMRTREPETSQTSWSNLFEQVPVARLEPEDVSALQRKMPFPLTEEETAWLAETTGRFPYVLSAALSLLLQRRTAGRPFEALEATHELIGKANEFFTPLWSGATPLEKGILALSAIRDSELRLKTCFSPVESAVGRWRDTLQSLQERGLLEGPTGSRPFSLGCSLWELWIIQQLESLTPPAVEELSGAFQELSGEEGIRELRVALEKIAAAQVTKDIAPWTHPTAEV